jgi:hypothetical protein
MASSKLEKVLDRTEHRPYPLPLGAWILHMRWRDLLFMHWPLQEAEAELEELEMTAQIGVTLPDAEPLLHYARRLDVIAWPPRLIDT